MRKNQRARNIFFPPPPFLSLPSSPGLSRATLHYLPSPPQKKWKRKEIKGTHPSSRLNMLMQSPQTLSPSVWPKLNGAPSCSPEFVAAKQSSKTWNESRPPCTPSRPLPNCSPRCLLATRARSQHQAPTSSTRSPPPPLARPARFSPMLHWPIHCFSGWEGKRSGN